MTIRQLLSCFISLVAIISCQEESLCVFDAVKQPYSDAAVQTALKAEQKMRLNQKYDTEDIFLKDLDITPADGAVFYAHHDQDTDWCGEEWYTSEYGFYIDSKGYACTQSKEDARLFVEYYPETGVIGIGQIPDACAAGETYVFEVGFATEQTKQPVEITVNVMESLPWAKSLEHEDGLTYTVYQEVNTDYTALEIPVNEDAVMEALELSSLDPLLDAMQGDTAFDTTMRGVNADGSYDDYNKYTANVAGYWFNQDGNVCEWKGEKWGAYIEWDRLSPMIFRLGQAVENNVVGSRYDMKIALIYGDKEAVLTFKLKIVEEVTDDLGLL